MSDTLRAALEYANEGFAVFPLRPGTKVPAVAHGVHDATTDPDRIRRGWNAAGQGAGIGLACDASGLFVVDIDPRSGFGSMQEAAKSLGLPTTYVVATPSGGWHFYFRGSGPNSVDKLRLGVDTRGIGGYVVAPPTPGYEPVCDIDPAPVPPALLESLRRPARVEAQGDAFDRRAVLEGVPEGRRQDTLFRYACSLRARGVDELEAEILLVHAAEQCDPAFDVFEACRIVERVYESYEAPDGPEALEQDPLLLPLTCFDREAVEWFWYPRIPLGKLTVIAGVQGHGKSYVTAALTAAATTGTPLPNTVGQTPPPGDVILASYEDGIADTVRDRMERCGADLERIHILPTGQDRRRRKAFKLADLPALEDALDKMPECRLLIIDPISSVMGGGIDNNSNEAVRAALEPLATMASQFGIAVIAIAHLNKTQLDNALYRVSGANAFTALPRSVLLVEHNEKEGRRSISQIKNNLDAKADPIGFDINPTGLMWRLGV